MNGRVIRRERDDRLVPVCVPKTQVEAAVFCSLLESESIPYFVFNDFFGSLKIGPMIPHYNEKAIFVPRSMYQTARDLLGEPITEDSTADETGLTLFEKLRMILEVAFFGWFMPGSARRRRGPEENEGNGAEDRGGR